MVVVRGGVDVPPVGGVCVGTPGRDVADRRGLLGEGREGALERLDTEGVHCGHGQYPRSVGGEGALQRQRLGECADKGKQSYLATWNIWAPYRSARSK